MAIKIAEIKVNQHLFEDVADAMPPDRPIDSGDDIDQLNDRDGFLHFSYLDCIRSGMEPDIFHGTKVVKAFAPLERNGGSAYQPRILGEVALNWWDTDGSPTWLEWQPGFEVRLRREFGHNGSNALLWYMDGAKSLNALIKTMNEWRRDRERYSRR